MIITDEQVIDATRARLAVELSDLEPSEQLLATVRQRYARRRAAIHVGGGAVIVLAAGVATPLAFSGNSASEPAGHASASAGTGTVVRLADDTFALPAGFEVTGTSPTRVRASDGSATLQFRLQSPAASPPPGAQHVHIGTGGDYWFRQTAMHKSLYVYFRDAGGRQVAIIITGTGMSRKQILGLVKHKGVQAGTPVRSG